MHKVLWYLTIIGVRDCFIWIARVYYVLQDVYFLNALTCKDLSSPEKVKMQGIEQNYDNNNQNIQLIF